MTPFRAREPFDWGSVLRLIQSEFACMAGRINPPSSILRLSKAALADLAAMAQQGEVWILGHPPIACMVLTPRKDALYVGKLAVATDQRGRGLARVLMAVAEGRASSRGLTVLELEARVELLENQAAFVAMGFVEVGRKAHAGFDQATSITYRRKVGDGVGE